MGGSLGKSAYKVINFPLQPLSKLTKSNWSVPLSGWVTGHKSFNESLKSDGNPIEQKINRGILKAFGDGGKPSVGYHRPYDFKAMQGMMQNDTSNQMMGDLLTQQTMANQAASTQAAANLQAENAKQQQNINSAMQNSRQNMNNFLLRTPVPSTFSAITPATQNKTTNNSFKTPNVAGLTFGS
jgi:hypothetical protein